MYCGLSKDQASSFLIETKYPGFYIFNHQFSTVADKTLNTDFVMGLSSLLDTFPGYTEYEHFFKFDESKNGCPAASVAVRDTTIGKDIKGPLGYTLAHVVSRASYGKW